MPIQGIFFDAAGVFYDRSESTTAFARRRLTELGYPAQLASKSLGDIAALHGEANAGRLSHVEYWDRVLRMYGVANVGKRGRLVKEILAQTFDVFAYPGGCEVMAGLKARGFVLGIITDTIYPVEWKMAWLEKVRVAEFIRIVTCSSVLHCHKPEPEMYLDALKQAGLTPDQAAFVGHAAVELEGARRVGMATVAVNYETGARADYYTQSLRGLLEVPIFQTVGRV